MTITLQLFGLFRQFGHTLEIELAEESTVDDLYPALENKLSTLHPEFNRDMLQKSRFSNDERIFLGNEKMYDQQQLAILPPVSGG